MCNKYLFVILINTKDPFVASPSAGIGCDFPTISVFFISSTSKFEVQELTG